MGLIVLFHAQGAIDFVEAPHAQHNSNKFGSAFA